jgi:hypothetical protein
VKKGGDLQDEEWRFTGWFVKKGGDLQDEE